MDATGERPSAASTTRAGKRRAVLVLQTNPLTLSSLRRCLSRHFEAVHVARSPEDAERALALGANPTHVVCGHDLGENKPNGSTLIARWRRQYASIERAILATGAEVEARAGGPVDAVFRKPSSPKELLALL